MHRVLGSLAVLSLFVVGCLEDDPNYIPPDSGESESASTTADGTGTGTTSTTDTGTTTTETGPMCQDPMQDCAGTCVDTSTDKNNCGMCFFKCNPAQEQCVDGMCVPK